MPPMKPPLAVVSASRARVCLQCTPASILFRLTTKQQQQRYALPGSGAAASTSATSPSSLSEKITKATQWPQNFFVASAPVPSLRGVATTIATTSPPVTNTTSSTHNSESKIASATSAEPSSSKEDITGSSTADNNMSEYQAVRLRRRARRNALAAEFASASGNPSSTTPSDGATTFPPDASALLGAAAAKAPASSLKRHLSALLSLSKPRLTVLVVLSAMAPYALYPSPDLLSPSLTEAPSLSPLTLLFLTSGTALCSASANALNMLYEPKTDAMMSRTRNRPLVRQILTKRAAVGFAVACALLGITSLYFGVNPTVSFLGAANIVIYAGIYTPMKRLSAINTWVGAVVGGVPPLMGWAAAAGESATGEVSSSKELLFNFPSLSDETLGPNQSQPSVSSSGGWLLSALLFAWQFPHFMALSHPIRDEYRAAGLRMLSWVNPARNSRVALRYSLTFFPICFALCWAGVTEWSFAATSLPVNGWLAWKALGFWKRQGHAGSARGLFWASVWHLPGVMVLALLQKKDMWGRVWESLFGEGRAAIGEEEEDEDGEHEWVYIDELEDEGLPPQTSEKKT
ncbi:hypothetical protein MKZ38_000092 [Zalerion maritima]|uniref:Protoheme IX farnesyltransferase, mitochondrial n=1 Tax=Zalerion maritima TaxID=339359 RepID=A0AAD5RT94_9PEZI|nr:hypothetical protein MKZ38_000092 [Zalerion maritima]